MIRHTPNGEGKGHRIGGLFLLCAVISCAVIGACAPSAAPSDRSSPAAAPRDHEPLHDPLTVYRDAGFLVGSGRFAPIGRFVFLPGPGDSTFAILSLAFSNSALRFRRDAPAYVAHYDVSFTLGPERAPLVRVASSEEVRVATFRETSRRDESVVYQAVATAPPGDHDLHLRVNGLAFSTSLVLDTTLTIPAFDTAAISDPIPSFSVRPREGRTQRPELIASPRATVEFDAERTLEIYFEAIAVPDTVALLEIVDRGTVISTDTLPLRDASADPSFSAVRHPLAEIPLTPGLLTLRVTAPLAGVRSEAPILVALHDDWLFRDYDDALNHLRYAARPDELDRLRAAPPDERAHKLRSLLDARDPDPATPENEFLAAYLQRLQDANDRFGETGTPGWLTDRGAVYVSLGPPDEVLPGLGAAEGSAGGQIWLYERPPASELRLVFVDTSGGGTYRLTAESRRAYQTALRALYP